MLWSPLGFIPPLTYPGICMIMRTVALGLYKSVAHVAEVSETHSTYAGYPLEGVSMV